MEAPTVTPHSNCTLEAHPCNAMVCCLGIITVAGKENSRDYMGN